MNKYEANTEYDYIEPDDTKYAIVKKDNCFGYLDLNTKKEILPCIYTYETISFNEGIACVCLNDKWGGVDYSNNTIIPCDYSSLCYGGNGLFVASKEGKFGIINKDNEIILEFKYDYIAPTNSKDSLFVARLEGKYGIVDCYGKVIKDFKYNFFALWNTDKFIGLADLNNKIAVYSLDKREFIR